jgi:hypothetical protein
MLYFIVDFQVDGYSAESVNTMHIERKAEISEGDFIDGYLIGNKPLIVTNAIESWDLFWPPTEWGRRFGEEYVQIYNDLFDLINVTKLGSFINEFMCENKANRRSGAQPYVRWYTKMKDVDFVWADEVFRHLADRWSLPTFLPDSDYLLPYSDRRRVSPVTDPFPAKGLFISGEGARTRLHRDPWVSDAVLCQLFGQKRVVFFSPAQEHLVVRNGVTVDIDAPDLDIFGDFAGVTPVAEDVLHAGEVLFIPRGWYHHVVSLTDSVSLTWNFVHLSTGKWLLQHLMSGKYSSEREILNYFLDMSMRCDQTPRPCSS